jgi:hypothetical protein
MNRVRFTYTAFSRKTDNTAKSPTLKDFRHGSSLVKTSQFWLEINPTYKNTTIN